MPYSTETLNLARRHVIEGREIVARQRALIGRLESCGQDTRLATSILDNMTVTLALMVEHRDRVVAKGRHG